MRVIRACRELGLRCVALYAPDDAGALHVREADAAIEVPSYLDAPALAVAASARRRPGAASRLRLPGRGRRRWPRPARPPASPSSARRPRRCARWPARTRPAAWRWRATSRWCPAATTRSRSSLPLLVKAAAGGGGRGMRVVRDRGELDGGHRGGPARGAGGVRRRHGAVRALRRAPAARRDPDPARRPRPRHPPGRARLLGAAAPPEGARGGARAGAAARAPRDARGRRAAAGRGGRLRRRRHGRVPGRPGRRRSSSSR